jgi:hypothetical protein
VGVAGLGLSGDAGAGKKGGKGKRKKCRRCTTCEACVKGKCLPLADGARCGKGRDGECVNGACGRPCEWQGNDCPEGASCPLESTYCVTETFCERRCETHADCPEGEICKADNLCGGDVRILRCGRVAPVR